MNINKLKKAIKSKQDDTVAKISKYLIDKHNPVINYVQEPGHTPSSLGTLCYRKIYYQYFKIDKEGEIDAKTARIFETGNYYESMVMSWLKGIGEHIPYRNRGNGEIPKNRHTGLPDPQFPISVPDWRIKKGYIDNVAVASDGKLWLYEIKSSAAFKFQGLEEPMEDHKVQTACYYKAFNDHLTKGDFDHIQELKGFSLAEGVKIIYVNKDTTDLKVFALRKADLEENVAALDLKIKKASEFIDLKILPPKTEDKCNWCPFASKCDNNWNFN